MADDPFDENGNGNGGRYTPTPREILYRTAREVREFKQDTKDEFDRIRRNTATTVRWLVGIVVVLVVAITGAAINARIQIETMSKQQSYEELRSQDQEQRLRYLEKYIGRHTGSEGPP